MAEVATESTELIFGHRVSAPVFLTIAIPTYKRFNLLKKAIESALAQSCSQKIEILVLDNDQSPEIVEAVQGLPEDRVCVFQNKKNLGMWGNMNRAIDISQGEWLLVLHDDDLMRSDAVARFEQIINSIGERAKDVGCLAGGAEIVRESGRQPRVNLLYPTILFPLDSQYYEINDVVQISDEMRLADMPKFCSSFFRRSTIERIGGWDSGILGYGDAGLLFDLQREKKLYTCHEIFGYYFEHEGNDSHPDKLWKTFSIESAHDFLVRHVDVSTHIGSDFRLGMEKNYFSSLFTNKITHADRKVYASQYLATLGTINHRLRFFFRNAWILTILHFIYIILRPLMRTIFRAAAFVMRRNRNECG